jgi:hypothetical protein
VLAFKFGHLRYIPPNLNRWLKAGQSNSYNNRPNTTKQVNYVSLDKFPRLPTQFGSYEKASSGAGPWMMDEVPDDGMQQWLALCSMEDDYYERLKRREDMEDMHDLWARYSKDVGLHTLVFFSIVSYFASIYLYSPFLLVDVYFIKRYHATKYEGSAKCEHRRSTGE